MSTDELHDLTTKLQDHRKHQLGYEPRLFADALLKLIHEIDTLKNRIAVLEGKPVAGEAPKSD